MEKVKIYNPDDFVCMRASCLLTSKILDVLSIFVCSGVSTEDLNKIVHALIISNGALPATLNYRGYPKSVCVSIDDVVCHGIPESKVKLISGNVLNIDVTVIFNGWYGDSSRMYYVGKIKPYIDALCKRTYECLELAIEQTRPGNTLGDIGFAIEDRAENHHPHYSVVRGYCGHGVGQVFHDAPMVAHHGTKGTGTILEEGMIFTIEPMINLGSRETYTLPDKWTVKTKDGKASAQFEHTVGLTAEGCEVFTRSVSGFALPPYDLEYLSLKSLEIINAAFLKSLNKNLKIFVIKRCVLGLKGMVLRKFLELACSEVPLALKEIVLGLREEMRKTRSVKDQQKINSIELAEEFLGLL